MMIMMIMMVIIMMMVVMMTHYDIKERYDTRMLCHKTDNGIKMTHRMEVIDMVMIMMMTMMTMIMTMPTMAIRLCVKMDDRR